MCERIAILPIIARKCSVPPVLKVRSVTLHGKSDKLARRLLRFAFAPWVGASDAALPVRTAAVQARWRLAAVSSVAAMALLSPVAGDGSILDGPDDGADGDGFDLGL